MIHRNSPLALLATSAASLFINPALAAPEDEAAVVVTATRMPARASELLNDITVLRREDIEASGAATLPELLAVQPGVQFSSNGGTGKTTSLFLRGAESRHTVVLIDGMRVNSATSGDTAVQHIPLSQIERIEIVRGPVSSLYGSEAIGGVVHIFTRRGDGPLSASVEASVGSHDTSEISAELSGTTSVVDYALSVGHYQTDGVSAVSNRRSSRYNRDDDRYRQDNATGRIGVRLAPGHELAANLFYSDGIGAYDSGPSAYDSRMTHTVQGIGIESRNRIATFWTSTLRVADSMDDSTNFASATFRSIFKTEQTQASWQNDFRTPAGSFLAGVERLDQRVASTTAFARTSRAVDSLLLGYQGRFNRHRVQVSARRDDNSQFGAKTTGMAYYGYQITPRWRISAGIGTSFSAPTFNQLYYPGYGNPDLKPEQGRNREASLVWEGHHARASATRFDNRVRDLIQSVLVTPPWTYAAENVQKARLSGWTLHAEGGTNGWNVRATLDVLEARDEDTDNWLPRRAREHLTLGLSKEIGAVTLSSEMIASGYRYDDAANTTRLGGYALVNAGLDYRATADITLFARAVNIFDKKYELAADYATTRAGLFVGVRQRLR